MGTLVELSNEDIRAFGVLAQLAENHSAELEQIAESTNVKPEWFVGLIMKLEPLLD